MATFKKSSRSTPPEKKGPPLSSPTDHKRTFDARPKPSDDRRREERARPEQHIDPIVSDPLDDPEGGPADEA
jgi:hypothetical protein